MLIRNSYKWKVTIEVGRHNITASVLDDTIYSGSYGIDYAIVHTGYNEETNANDIGLVRSTSYIRFRCKKFAISIELNKIPLSQGVGPACLPFAYQNFAVSSGTVMTALGWGSTEYAMTASADKKSWILKKVLLTVNSTLPLCKNNDLKLCTIGNYNSITKHSKDSCQRDSGGGLYGFMSNRFYSFGIIS